MTAQTIHWKRNGQDMTQILLPADQTPLEPRPPKDRTSRDAFLGKSANFDLLAQAIASSSLPTREEVVRELGECARDLQLTGVASDTCALPRPLWLRSAFACVLVRSRELFVLLQDGLVVVSHSFSIRFCLGLPLRVGEVVELFLQRLVLRVEFGILKLKLNYLLAEGVYLRKRNRQLKDRLFALRRWHVQLPPVDEKPVAGGEHEPKAGAELEPGEAGRFEDATHGNKKPNV